MYMTMQFVLCVIWNMKELKTMEYSSIKHKLAHFIKSSNNDNNNNRRLYCAIPTKWLMGCKLAVGNLL